MHINAHMLLGKKLFIAFEILLGGKNHLEYCPRASLPQNGIMKQRRKFLAMLNMYADGKLDEYFKACNSHDCISSSIK